MKTKALISFAVTAKLICVFVFVYAKCWFSHDADHLYFVLITILSLNNFQWFSTVSVVLAMRKIKSN